jgi:hypothetical protein
MRWVDNAMRRRCWNLLSLLHDERDRLQSRLLHRDSATCAEISLKQVNRWQAGGKYTDGVSQSSEDGESQKTYECVDCDHIVFVIEL